VCVNSLATKVVLFEKSGENQVCFSRPATSNQIQAAGWLGCLLIDFSFLNLSIIQHFGKRGRLRLTKRSEKTLRLA